MVRFEERKIVIELDTATPAEDWINLWEGMLGVVRGVKSDTIQDDSFYTVIDFLIATIPRWEDAKKMVL